MFGLVQMSAVRLRCDVVLPRLIFDIFAHGSAIPGPIDEVIRMFPPERFGDMAAPADGRMGLKEFWEFLRRHVGPLNGFLVRAQQSRAMIVPMNLFNRLATISAGSATKPLLNNIPHVAALRIVFNLAETRLLAVLAFRPARTLVELQTSRSAFRGI